MLGTVNNMAYKGLACSAGAAKPGCDPTPPGSLPVADLHSLEQHSAQPSLVRLSTVLSAKVWTLYSYLVLGGNSVNK